MLRPTATGYVSVVARRSGKCLDVGGASTADGARVFPYTCNGGRNQEWAVRQAASGHVTLVARHSAKCLDVAGTSQSDGASLRQSTCTGGPNQQLRFG
ncbi:RICIN domain-containing protein [Streptomyces sp. TX20-6-3]|uniref:RICIN domain-containing protein n=1 Tax=Streptomyces sp. TX20-6-3 TaxID=3028705 RepID=UPI0029BE045D|nr:RICIN domain-containing protein [Streptomyces sp. TX20-6-3]MDX2564756.1 RICIN domain-containing protein [Streptomyces sp. TX20-6-3]